MSGRAGIFDRLDTVLLRVRDLDRSRAWYERVLELAPVYEDKGEGLVIFGCGGATSLTLWRLKPGESLPGPSAHGTFPIFRATDLDAAHARLEGHGAKVEPIEQGEGIRYFTFYDSDGNRIDACEFRDA